MLDRRDAAIVRLLMYLFRKRLKVFEKVVTDVQGRIDLFWRLWRLVLRLLGNWLLVVVVD